MWFYRGQNKEQKKYFEKHKTDLVLGKDELTALGHMVEMYTEEQASFLHSI